MEQLGTIKHRNKQEKHRKNSELLTIREIFRKIYCFYSTSEAGKRTKINTVR